MTNDIRKHIMLIDSIILDESFKDAQAKFSASTSSEEVKQYLDKFKELSKRNIIKGQDKDIGTWIKGDWDSFKKFVDSNSSVQTNRQTKAVQKKDSIVVYKDDTKQVVIPLTKEASIQYGKNTAWCTAYTDAPNQFIKYFYMRKITLFYVLFKDGNKYACAFHPEHADTIECFDKADKSMTFKKFEKSTGITKEDIQNWYNSNKTKIEDSRDLNKLSEEAQLDAVNEDGTAIEYIENPSEQVQLAAVNQSSYAIFEIMAKGIVPSEEVQLAVVNKNGYVIKYIIAKGISPSEKVQLAAVTQDGSAIEYIVKKGIVPSEQVQLAAVTQDGRAIEYIRNPSERVQLAAVTQDGAAIEYIDNPTEKVKALHKKLWT